MGCCGKAQGAVRLVKAALRVGKLPDVDITARRAVCDACDENDWGWCKRCGCLLWGKTRLRQEGCPLGKWATLTVDGSLPGTGREAQGV